MATDFLVEIFRSSFPLEGEPPVMSGFKNAVGALRYAPIAYSVKAPDVEDHPTSIWAPDFAKKNAHEENKRARSRSGTVNQGPCLSDVDIFPILGRGFRGKV